MVNIKNLKKGDKLKFIAYENSDKWEEKYGIRLGQILLFNKMSGDNLFCDVLTNIKGIDKFLYTNADQVVKLVPKKKTPKKDIADLVIDDIKARKEFGIKKYGKALNPYNNRNSVQDFYEEILDAAHYIKQWNIEREEMIEVLKYYSKKDIGLKAWNLLVQLGVEKDES